MKKILIILLLILSTPVFAQYKITDYTRDTNMTDDDIVCGANSPDGATPTNACYTLGALGTYLGSGGITGVNWGQITGTITNQNWLSTTPYLREDAINWFNINGVAKINTGGINWSNINGLNTINTTAINWPSLINSEIQRNGLNWSDANLFVESATGNVGIGTIYNTSGTGERLTVSSPTIKIAKFISTQTSSSGTGTALVDIVTDDGAAISANDIIARLRFLGSTNTSHSLGVGADIAVLANEDWTGSANGTSIQFNTASNGSAGAATRMTINQANVGINTASPSARLEVSTTTAQDLLKVNDNGAGDTTPFVVNSDGNVGIGSSNPQAKMSILSSGTTTGSALNIRDSAGTLLFTQLDGGNVGINSATPGSKLDVQGAIRAFTATSPITKKTGANTACNTTCAGTMCIWAQNTADFSLVDCVDATADVCGCLGP